MAKSKTKRKAASAAPMSSTGTSTKIPHPLSTELVRLTSSTDPSQRDLERIVRLCSKILRIAPSSIDIIRTKVVALVRLERYEHALGLIRSSRPIAAGASTINADDDAAITELGFEEAYCLYRTNALADSLTLVERLIGVPGIPSTALHSHLLHLQAQVLYRLERFQECLDGPYSQLTSLTNVADPDLKSNILAAHASLAMIGPNNVDLGDSTIDAGLDLGGSESYEILYNQACRTVGKRSYAHAEQLLKKAKRVCRDVMTNDMYQEEVILRELATIDAQLAYVWQAQGRYQSAMDQYKAILACRGVDPAVSGIAANNILAACTTHQDMDNSSKFFKMFLAPASMSKYNSLQRKTVDINNTILLFCMGKVDRAKEQLAIIQEKYPGDDLVMLVCATMNARGKRAVPALRDEIQRLATEYPDAPHIQFALLQTLIDASAWDKAIAHAEHLYNNPAVFNVYRAGLASTLVWLHKRSGSADSALDVLDRVAKEVKSDDRAAQIQLATLKSYLNMHQEAAADYIRLVKADPLDTRALAGLVVALAQTDPVAAEKYAGQLPGIDGRDRVHQNDDAMQVEIDTDALEAAIIKRKDGAAQNIKAASDATGAEAKLKKKRKRKVILPKNYDPNVAPDPDRWIPKRFRKSATQQHGVTGRKRRDKRTEGDAKGTQGVHIEGGGIGSTGSARIAGLGKPNSGAATTDPKPQSGPTAHVAAPAFLPAASSSQAGSGNKKNGKKKGRK